MRLSPAHKNRVTGAQPYIIMAPSSLGVCLAVMIVTPVASAVEGCPCQILYSMTKHSKRVTASRVHAISGDQLGEGVKSLGFDRVGELGRIFRRVFYRW